MVGALVHCIACSKEHWHKKTQWSFYQDRCLLWNHEEEARWSFSKRDFCYDIMMWKRDDPFTKEMSVTKSRGEKKAQMVLLQERCLLWNHEEQRRHNDLLQERCLLWKHEHRAKKVQWSFYKRNTCYEIMRSKEGTMIFVQEICLLWNHEHRAVEVAMSSSIWLCSFLWETQTTVFPADFYSVFVQSSSLLPWRKRKRKRKRKRRLFYLQILCVLWCIAWSKEGALAQEGTMILLQERCLSFTRSMELWGGW
jgi:hypothetical protein